jgi:hypothetical protein
VLSLTGTTSVSIGSPVCGWLSPSTRGRRLTRPRDPSPPWSPAPGTRSRWRGCPTRPNATSVDVVAHWGLTVAGHPIDVNGSCPFRALPVHINAAEGSLTRLRTAARRGPCGGGAPRGTPLCQGAAMSRCQGFGVLGCRGALARAQRSRWWARPSCPGWSPRGVSQGHLPR